jgi:hypothetical protein
MNYIKSRLKEYSSFDGAVFIAAGVGYLIFQGIAVYISYAAIAYGIYKIVKADK